jgi:hypothetical protein
MLALGTRCMFQIMGYENLPMIVNPVSLSLDAAKALVHQTALAYYVSCRSNPELAADVRARKSSSFLKAIRPGLAVNSW